MDIDASWAAQLQKRLEENGYDYQVENISISGNTTSNGLQQLPQALEKYHPQLTIIELGGNDGLRGISLPVIKKNLQSLIDLAKNANSKVLLVGVRMPPNLGESYTAQFQKIFSDLAEDNNIALVPLFLKGVDDSATLMGPDRIHPTKEAQSILLLNVWDKIKELL